MARFNSIILLAIIAVIAALIAPSNVFAATPAVGAITPAKGSSAPNTAVTFTTTYTDADGWQNIQYVNLLVNTSTSGLNCCYLYYNQNENKLYMRDDANTSWLGGYLPGTAYVIENSYAKLDCSKTTFTGSGRTLTVKWSITFKSPFVGKTAKNTYLYVKDDTGGYKGWVRKGTWTIGPNSNPSVGTINPSSGASAPNSAVTFTATYLDPDGWQNLQAAYLLINTSTSGTNCCYAYYDQNSNRLYLRNDANKSWLGGYAPGSSYTIENSYAKLNCSGTAISGSSATLTVQWNIAFKSQFASATPKNLYLYVKDDSNVYQGWSQKGTWTVTSATPPSITTTEPANGAVINAEP